MKIEQFEDVKAWQMARELTKLVYKVAASEQPLLITGTTAS